MVGLRLGQPLQHGGQVLVGAEELVLRQGQVVPLADGEAIEVGVPGGVGDLAGAHVGKALHHGGGVVRLVGVGVGGQHGGDALGHRLGGQDDHLLVLTQGDGLLGGHNDVFVVGQDVDDPSRSGVDGLEDVLGGGIHGLTASHQLIHSQVPEHGLQSGPGADGHIAELLLRGGVDGVGPLLQLLLHGVQVVGALNVPARG